MSTEETTQQQQATIGAVASQKQTQEQDPINIQEFLYLCLAKWYWFAISIAVCLGLAIGYLLITPKIYTRSASILIKDDGKGKSITSDMESFSDFGMFSSHTNVNNEMGQLMSPDLMEEVIARLRLDYDYATDGRFQRDVLYGKTLPYVAEFIDVRPEQDAALQIDINNATGQITFSDFELDDIDDLKQDKVTAMPGDTVVTPIGRVLVLPTGQGNEEDQDPVERLYVNKTNMHDAITAYCKDLSVSQDDEKSNIIVLKVTNTSIQRAEDLLNTLIGVYNENWVKDKNQIAVSTSMFINDRLGVIEGELGNVDNDISSFKSQHLLPDVQQAARLAMEQATQADASIKDLNTQIYMARYILGNLTNDNNRFQLLPTNSGIDNPALANQIATYNQQLLERNSLVSNSSTRNPLVVDMDAALDGMRGALATAINNQIVALEEQVRSQRSTGARATSQISSNPQQSKYLLTVERQQKVKESLYLFLLQKREENELNQAFTAYNTRIITMPHGLMEPTAPVTLNILLMSFVLGLLMPAGLIYMQEITNTRVRGRKDLEGLPIPFAGEIPLFGESNQHSLLARIRKHIGKEKKEKNDVKKIVVREGSRDIINEAFRVLRTNINFMAGHGDRAQAIIITSFNPGSGKSFITMNLAMSFAIRHKRVLVIDGDLRHGSASAYVAQTKKGLSDYLSGRIDDYEQLIVKYPGHPYLNVLPIGIIPPNPTELIEDPRFAKLIEEVRDKYDYVFIDCPPIDIVADTQIIERYADRCIFVVRTGLLERSMIPEIEAIYRDHRLKNVSLVLNGSETATGRYGYRQGYRYGYRYGYGYATHYGQLRTDKGTEHDEDESDTSTTDDNNSSAKKKK